jgi:hypothetical protein
MSRPLLTLALAGMLAANASPANAFSCKRYVPGCTAPDFIEGAWSNPKPWWADEIPPTASLPPRSKLEAMLVGDAITRQEATQIAIEATTMHEITVHGCKFVGNRYKFWRLMWPREVQGC